MSECENVPMSVLWQLRVTTGALHRGRAATLQELPLIKTNTTSTYQTQFHFFAALLLAVLFILSYQMLPPQRKSRISRDEGLIDRLGVLYTFLH